MKPVIIDMLRAHLLIASLTAVGVEVVLCLALPVLPVPEAFFDSTSFRLFALAVIVGGVAVAREFAQDAFYSALQRDFVTPAGVGNASVALAPDCPRRWLVVLHLRLTGRPFVLAGH
ncbi:hypothetical protein [Paraburkholderia antibiotica]|uniref:Uncharacterized protein n=1 Tax=Paraburkholderia antibiotica TaxID=2728839 RepID=A0A7X9X4B3_9BURK|nr:hypothetical protein [Paraburkholderia antibiotica]NML31143.1 hypothetical protein [Paraburkholderia antibiotica]